MKSAPAKARASASASTRPGQPGARPRLAAGPVRRTGVPRVWRLASVALVLVLLAAFLFPTVLNYVDQRGEIAQLEQQIEAQRGDIEDLEGEVDLWNDPDFIEREARDRLRFVRPGETAFSVLDDTGDVLVEPLPGMASVTNDIHETRPWYGEVWESVKSANEGMPTVVRDAP